MNSDPPTDPARAIGTSEVVPSPPRPIWARLFIGWTILISAEVFSGASLKQGLWHPWTLLVTYWLYFGHFFFFTTLSIWTRRTSLSSLYLWGVLFGLYESWITKVIWHGYEGNGNLVLGSMGPFGFSEFSMVVIFHPVMAFILPLAAAGVVFPSLRPLFPGINWLIKPGRGPLLVRIYMILSLGTIVAMNSGGPLNLLVNLGFGALVFGVLLNQSKPCRQLVDARPIVVFGRKGYIGLCLYLGLLYGVTYFHLRPEGLPSASVQWLTAAMYAIPIIGLWLQPRGTPRETSMDQGSLDQDRKALITLVGSVLGLGLIGSLFAGQPALYVAVLVSFIFWTPVGFILIAMTWVEGLRSRG